MTAPAKVDAAEPAARQSSDVLISYSRHDAAFCEALTRRLRGFVAPPGLGLSRAPCKVFRDIDDLVGAGYYDSIEAALRDARKLVLLCSPHARASRFVDDEVRRFAEARGATNIIPLLLSGAANNEARSEDDKAFPEALCRLIELPLAIDYRGFDPARQRPDGGLFYRAWYTLLAALYDRPREEIEQRDLRRRRRRLRAIVVGTSAVIVSLSVLTAVALWQRHQAILARDRATARQLAAQAEIELADPEREARQAVLLAAASTRLDAGSAVARQALETGLRRLPPDRERTLPAGTAAIAALAVSPDGDHLAALDAAGSLWLWRISDGRTVPAIATRETAAAPDFTDDGGLVAITTEEDGARMVAVHRTDTGERVRAAAVMAPPAIIGGRILALARGDPPGAPVLTDLATGAVLRRFDRQAAVGAAALAADGRVAAMVEGDSVTIVRADDGSTMTHRLDAALTGVAASPDGSRIAGFTADGRILAFPAAGDDKPALVATGAKILNLAFSPAGGYLIAVVEPGRQEIWTSTLSQKILTVAGRTGEYAVKDQADITQRAPVVAVRFTPADVPFATGRADGMVSLWTRGATLGAGTYGVNLLDHAEALRLSHGRTLGGLAISADGAHVVTAGGGPWMDPGAHMHASPFLVRLWDARTGSEIARLTDQPVTAMALSPDGKRLATANPPGRDGNGPATVGIWALRSNLETADATAVALDAAAATSPQAALMRLLQPRRAQGVTIENGAVATPAAPGGITLPGFVAPAHGPAEPAIATSRDGQRIVVSDGRSVWLVDAASRTAMAKTFADGAVIGIAAGMAPTISADGKVAGATVMTPPTGPMTADRLLTLPPGLMVTHVWRTDTGAETATIDHRVAQFLVALDHDGRTGFFASLRPPRRSAVTDPGDIFPGWSKALRVVDLASSTDRIGPIALDGLITMVKPSADGRHVAAYVSADLFNPTFTIWDSSTGERLLTIPTGLGDLIGPMAAMPGAASGPRVVTVHDLDEDGRTIAALHLAIRAGATPSLTVGHVIWQPHDLIAAACARLPADDRRLRADELSVLGIDPALTARLQGCAALASVGD